MKIFVSYSRRDAGDFADQINRHLSTFNYNIFTDIDDIKVGEIWSNIIEENISNCDIFVVIVTHGALHSPHVEREVLQAQKEKKSIIPCFHRTVIDSDIKWGLDKIQGLEFDDKYELARNIHSKITSSKDRGRIFRSTSKTVEETKTPTITIKSDVDRLSQKKETLPSSNANRGAIGGSVGVPSAPKYTASESDNKEKKYTETDSSRQSQGINLKLIIIPIIVVAIIGLVFSITYFSGLPADDKKQTITTPETKEQQTIPSNNGRVTDNDNNFLEYVNNIYGIRLQYPSTWLKMEDISLGNFTGMTLYDIAVFAPIQETAITKLWIGVNKLPNPNINLNQYHNLIRTGLSNGDPNFKVIEETIDGTLSDNPAYRLGYIYSSEYDGQIETYQGLNIGTVIGDYAYFLMFETPMEKYSQHFPTVQQMINSFKITSNN